MQATPRTVILSALRQGARTGLRAGCLTFAVCTAAALVTGHAAQAQTDPEVYAPCLAEHATAPAMIGAMQAAGWTHVVTPDAGLAAMQGPAEVRMALIRLEGAFASVDETMAFVASAAETAARDLSLVDVFTQGEMSAAISVFPHTGTAADLSCIFAGPALPGTGAILGNAPAGAGMLSFVFNGVTPEPRPTTRFLQVDAMRFVGDASILAPLAGREGIIVTHRFGTSQ